MAGFAVGFRVGLVEGNLVGIRVGRLVGVRLVVETVDVLEVVVVVAPPSSV